MLPGRVRPESVGAMATTNTTKHATASMQNHSAEWVTQPWMAGNTLSAASVKTATYRTKNRVRTAEIQNTGAFIRALGLRSS